MATNKTSLLDDADFGSIGSKRSGDSGSSDPKKMIKIGVAAVLMIAAAILLAYNFGLIGGDGGPSVPVVPPTPEEVQEFEKQQKERELLEKTIPSSGA